MTIGKRGPHLFEPFADQPEWQLFQRSRPDILGKPKPLQQLK